MILKVRLQPRGSTNEIIGWENGLLKVKVSAPPVDGAANEALVELLGKEFKIPKSRLAICAGERSKNKTIEISGCDSELERKIRNYVRT